MKRCLLFTLLISFIGYSQNPIQPNHPNFEEGLPQDLVEKMKPINLEFGDDEMMDFNPIQRVNGMKLQSFQSDMMVENVNEVIYRFDGETYIKFDENDLTGKYTRQVDENGNQTHYIQYNWDSESQSFVPSSKSEYTYDENGIQTFYIYYSWDSESQSFVPNDKNEYTYDENGNLTLMIIYNWDSESQSFVPSSKYENTYDENGNRTHYIRYNWDSESQSFVPNYKYEYTYDEDGNQTLQLYYNWNTELQSFVPSRKYENTYDENGNQTHYIRYNWDSESQSFVPSSKSEYTYDENGIQTFYIYYSWDSESQSFVPSRKYENTYDENGNRTHYIRYNWDSESQSFVPILKDETTYDSNFTPVWTRTQWKIEKYYSGLGVYKPSFVKDYSIHSETDTELVIVGIIKQYDTNFNTWNELEGEEFKSYWYYTKTQSLSTNSVEPNSFSIYPNPTSNSLQIHSSESLSNPIFELYDVKGSKILSNPFKLTEPIDVSDLQPSMYIYNVKDGSEVKQSGKIIKE